MLDCEGQPGDAGSSWDENADGLRARIAELEEAVAARDAFVSIVAHELRNPMTPIRAQVDLLLRLVNTGRAKPERLKTGLERIGWLIERYVARATTLLDITRVNSGKLQLRTEPVRLDTLVRDVCASLQPLAARAGSAISIDMPGAIQGVWDLPAMEQIVENLVSNAIKYGAGKPILIQAAAQGPSLLLRVQDHGVGISEAQRSRMFDCFERAVSIDDSSGGFGIGLWLVRQLVAAMDGEIDAESTPGEGTIFSVLLPMNAEGKA